MQKIALSVVLLGILGFAVTAQSKAAKLESSPLSQEAERQLALMQASVYQHHTDVDETTGRFNYDCSGFLDYALQRIAPAAYAELPITKAGSKRPLAQDFYTLFSHTTKPSPHWERIRKVNHVHAGDIVAWLRPMDNDSKNTGHVMVIKTEPSLNPKESDEMLISVIDSTTSPHAQDTRRKRQTGLGSGTIGIIMDSKGEPIAYHWRGGASRHEERTPIAFGRLL